MHRKCFSCTGNVFLKTHWNTPKRAENWHPGLMVVTISFAVLVEDERDADQKGPE